MKHVTLTALQSIRLILMIDAHQGTRKDLRMLGELRARLGVSDDTLAHIVRPVQGGAAIDNEIMTMPDVEISLVPEEARRLLEILNTQTLVVRDLVWAEPLAKQLEAIVN